MAAFGDTLLGKPKGVMLSHLNIVSATLACIHQLGQYAPNSQVCCGEFGFLDRSEVASLIISIYIAKSQDILFSFLPLAHTLERCCELAVFMAGGAIEVASVIN